MRDSQYEQAEMGISRPQMNTLDGVISITEFYVRDRGFIACVTYKKSFVPTDYCRSQLQRLVGAANYAAINCLLDEYFGASCRVPATAHFVCE